MPRRINATTVNVPNRRGDVPLYRLPKGQSALDRRTDSLIVDERQTAMRVVFILLKGLSKNFGFVLAAARFRLTCAGCFALADVPVGMYRWTCTGGHVLVGMYLWTRTC